MMQKKSQLKHALPVSYFTPSFLMMVTFLIFNVLTGFWLWGTSWKEDLYFKYSSTEYFDGLRVYLNASIAFIVLFIFSAFAFGGKPFSIKSTSWVANNFSNLKFKEKYNYYIYLTLCILGVILTAIYFVDGGYEKILAFGTIMDSWAFRLIGYDDRSRFLIAALEASRRVLLPFSVGYFFALYRLARPRGILLILILGAFFQLLGAAMTLDRAPILLFFVMFLYVSACVGMTYFKILRTVIITILVVLPVAGLTTFLQYNISSFTLADVLETGQKFLLHRTLIVPSIASIELSFVPFPEHAPKLYLQFSRLTALFGGTYVGTEDVNSIYVTPVGAIADAWRNFGYLGVCLSAVFLGAYAALLDRFIKKVNPISRIVHSFNALSLAFYFIFGVLFSQGIVFQMLLGASLLFYEASKNSKQMKG